MKYTKSIDGTIRMTVRAEVRVTKDEYLLYNRAARKLGYKSLSDYLNSYLNVEWKEALMFTYEDEFETNIEEIVIDWLKGK